MYSIIICCSVVLRRYACAALVFRRALAWVGRSLVNHVIDLLYKDKLQDAREAYKDIYKQLFAAAGEQRGNKVHKEPV
jgi:hypothetical protein